MHTDEDTNRDEWEVPLCPKCQEAIQGNPQFCKHCGEGFSGTSNFTPHSHIPNQASFQGNIMKSIFDPRISLTRRVITLLIMICLFPPFLIIIPFMCMGDMDFDD